MTISNACQPDFLLEQSLGLPFSFERGVEGRGSLLTQYQRSPFPLKVKTGPALECQTPVADWPCSLRKSLQALGSLSYPMHSES